MLDGLRSKFSRRPQAAPARKPVRPPPPIPGGYHEPFHAVVVGGGAAALEAVLAVREHAGPLADITLVSPETALTLPAAGAAGTDAAPTLALAEFAAGLDAEFLIDRLVRIDAGERRIFTERRRLVDYDALVLCIGAEPSLRDGRAVDGLPPGASDRRISTITAEQAEATARDVAKAAGATPAPAGGGPADAGATPRLAAHLAAGAGVTP